MLPNFLITMAKGNSEHSVQLKLPDHEGQNQIESSLISVTTFAECKGATSLFQNLALESG